MSDHTPRTRMVRPHRVRGEQFSATVLEGTDRGRGQYADFAVDESLTPLMRLGIVEKQGQASEIRRGVSVLRRALTAV